MTGKVFDRMLTSVPLSCSITAVATARLFLSALRARRQPQDLHTIWAVGSQAAEHLRLHGGLELSNSYDIGWRLFWTE